MAAWSCGVTACVKWPAPEVSSKQPDQVLFERAMSAVEQKRFDVANLTLQTLVNTYPTSEYASKAKLTLEDPRIAECSVSEGMKFISSSFSSTCKADKTISTPPAAPDSFPAPEPE